MRKRMEDASAHQAWIGNMISLDFDHAQGTLVKIWTIAGFSGPERLTINIALRYTKYFSYCFQERIELKTLTLPPQIR